MTEPSNANALSGANEVTASVPEVGANTYPQVFQRSLGKFASFAVAFSFISISTGLFVTYGFVLATGGPLGIWTWPIVTAGMILIALVYGMMASRIPISGYSYQWVSRLTSPLLGWWFGWVSLAFLVIGTVSVDYGLAQVAAFPLFGISFTPGRASMAATVLILIQACMIVISTRTTTRVNGSAVVAELLGVGCFAVIIGAAVIFGHIGSASNLVSHGVVAGGGYFSWLGPFMLSGLLGCYTYVGWESAANLAEETHNPKHVVPRAMVRAIVLSGVVGMVFLIAITAAIKNVKAVTASSAPVAAIVQATLGSAAERVLLAVVMVAMFACATVVMVTASRLIHSMARDDRLPGSKYLRAVPRATGGPTWATAVAGVAAILIILVFGSRPNALAALLGSSALLPALLYLGTVLVFVFSSKGHIHSPDDFSLGRWQGPVSAGAILWLILEVLMLALPSEFRSAQIYVVGIFALGAIVFAGLMLTRVELMKREPADLEEDVA